MHNRAEARYTNLMAEILADLQGAIERALAAGVAWDAIVVDPGFGFGKTRRPQPRPARATSARSASSAGRSCSGRRASRPSARSSTCRADERLEATLATTALGIAAGVDIVRVHDVRDERPGGPDGGRDRPRRGRSPSTRGEPP